MLWEVLGKKKQKTKEKGLIRPRKRSSFGLKYLFWVATNTT